MNAHARAIGPERIAGVQANRPSLVSHTEVMHHVGAEHAAVLEGEFVDPGQKPVAHTVAMLVHEVVCPPDDPRVITTVERQSAADQRSDR